MRLILALVACLLAAPMPLSGRSTSTPNLQSALGSTSSEPSSEDAAASSTTTSTLTSSTSVDTTTTSGATTSTRSTSAASVSSSTPATTEASTALTTLLTPTTVKVTNGKENKASAYLAVPVMFMTMTTLAMVVVVVVLMYKQGLCNCFCKMFPCCKELKDYLDEEESAGLYDAVTWSHSNPGFRLVTRTDPR
ncbi:hypothetical protein [Orf virus]|uniref:Uncharacterized protein n=1 Tax=Orf virus TaxID=10258 RepID=A0A0R8IEB8_ORFV|nr:hypothetical protein [Orf virus]